MVIDMKTLEIKTTDLKKLRKAMEKELHAKRYEHTLSVAYTAASLAMIHDVEPNKALIAGMLHDCAKCLSNKKLISICEKNDLPISEITESGGASACKSRKLSCERKIRDRR